MDRARALALLNGRLLQGLSRRSTASLRGILPLRIALPHVEPFLAANVEKEIRKDALAIRCAAEALSDGTVPGADEARRILEATRAIDRQFLGGIGAFPVRIEIPWQRIAPLRLKRIELVLGASHRVLGLWQPGRSLRAALQLAYRRETLERLLLDDLQLYAREVEALSYSVRLPALLAPLRERLARGLLDLMAGVSSKVAREVSAGVYRKPGRREGV